MKTNKLVITLTLLFFSSSVYMKAEGKTDTLSGAEQIQSAEQRVKNILNNATSNLSPEERVVLNRYIEIKKYVQKDDIDPDILKIQIESFIGEISVLYKSKNSNTIKYFSENKAEIINEIIDIAKELISNKEAVTVLVKKLAVFLVKNVIL